MKAPAWQTVRLEPKPATVVVLMLNPDTPPQIIRPENNAKTGLSNRRRGGSCPARGAPKWEQVKPKTLDNNGDTTGSCGNDDDEQISKKSNKSKRNTITKVLLKMHKNIN